ncbi:MAG TPA: hypothetical protein VMW27_04920 [Thermoanaerobaculia bacterium]|nr:hypothetical protein [Thermoanaerobaculia bacterium]
MRKRIVFAAMVLMFLLGLSPLAVADPVIQRGIDAFTTPADGSTYYDFAQRPIPAGFFCNSSKAFAGRVALKGLPLETKVPGQLRGADTIIERLDDAVFNAKGTAATRIQFRALSLVSIAPIKTSCGAFHVYVSLGGPQQVTAMSIHRTREGGGSFVAPLAIDARLTFVSVKPPQNKGARKLELTGKVTFPPKPMPWSLATDPTAGLDSVVVDTNGDLKPDTRLPGTSNFAPGRSSGMDKGSCCPECHESGGEMHCYIPYTCYVGVMEDCGPIV